MSRCFLFENGRWFDTEDPVEIAIAKTGKAAETGWDEVRQALGYEAEPFFKLNSVADIRVYIRKDALKNSFEKQTEFRVEIQHRGHRWAILVPAFKDLVLLSEKLQSFLNLVALSTT